MPLIGTRSDTEAFRRVKLLTLSLLAGVLWLGMTGCTSGGAVRADTDTVDDPVAEVVNPAQVYLIRGGLAGLLSLGMDTLAEKLRELDVQAVTWPLGNEEDKLARIAARYQTRGSRGPVILIGHSRGGGLAIRLAAALDARNVPVDLVVTFDPTEDGPVTDNVRKLINFHTGADRLFKIVHASDSYPGMLINVDVSRRTGFSDEGWGHFSFEEAPSLHDEVIAEVLDVIRRSPTHAACLDPDGALTCQ